MPPNGRGTWTVRWGGGRGWGSLVRQAKRLPTGAQQTAYGADTLLLNPYRWTWINNTGPCKNHYSPGGGCDAVCKQDVCIMAWGLHIIHATAERWEHSTVCVHLNVTWGKKTCHALSWGKRSRQCHGASVVMFSGAFRLHDPANVKCDGVLHERWLKAGQEDWFFTHTSFLPREGGWQQHIVGVGV